MDSHQTAIQIKFWLELQLQITEMLPLSESLLCRGYHSDQRFIRSIAPIPKTLSNYEPVKTNKPMIRPTSNDVVLTSQFPYPSRDRRVTNSTNPFHSFGRLLKGAINKCALVSFKLFKIVDLIGCGTIEDSNHLIITNSQEICLKKENKIINFKIDSHEFKNEFQLTDLYYDQVQKKQDQDQQQISTKSSNNSSKEFFSTTRELTMHKTNSVFSSRRDIGVSCFQTPNKPSKKVFSSSMKKLKPLTDSKSSLICKKEQLNCAIPNTMKIRSPEEIFEPKFKNMNSSLTSKKSIFHKSILGSVRKILFDKEDLELSEKESRMSEDLSSHLSVSDSLSFYITRKTPSLMSNNQSDFIVRSDVQSESQKYSWLNLFQRSILSFEKNENSDLFWIIDNQQNLKILRGNKTVSCSKQFKNIIISACKWINKNTLVCGSENGKLLFGTVKSNTLEFVDLWKVSDKAIIDLQSSDLGLSLVCLDQTKRLFQFCLRRVLNSGRNFKKELNLSSRKIFSKVSKILFHPKKPKILIIFKKIPRNEIIFYNISTKQVIHRRQLISKTHSFSFHDTLNVIFLSQSKGNNHFISIYHLSNNLTKWFKQGNLGHGKSVFEYRNLQTKNGLLIATTKSQKLYIWKQENVVQPQHTLPSSSSFINGNNLFR
jgi:hypothetical protein